MTTRTGVGLSFDLDSLCAWCWRLRLQRFRRQIRCFRLLLLFFKGRSNFLRQAAPAQRAKPASQVIWVLASRTAEYERRTAIYAKLSFWSSLEPTFLTNHQGEPDSFSSPLRLKSSRRGQMWRNSGRFATITRRLRQN